MNTEENDKLWKLLGEAQRPNVSPFFARNVLRAVRQDEPAQPQLSAPLSLSRRLHRWSWKLTLAGTCVIVALATISPSAFRHHRADSAQTGVAKQIAGNPDYEVIKHLDELVADEESSLWLDDSVH